MTILSIPSFLVTLGMMQLIHGVDMGMTYANPVPVTEQTFNTIPGSGKPFGLPSFLVWSLVIVGPGHSNSRGHWLGRWDSHPALLLKSSA